MSGSSAPTSVFGNSSTVIVSGGGGASVFGNSSTVIASGGGGGGGGSIYTGNISIPTTTGSSGMYLTSSGYTTITTQADVKISGPNPTLSTDHYKININEMIGVIEMMKEVFCIIPKNQKLLDANSTLKDSYEQYESILKQKLSDPSLIEAYNEYKTLEILSKEEKE